MVDGWDPLPAVELGLSLPCSASPHFIVTGPDLSDDRDYLQGSTCQNLGALLRGGFAHKHRKQAIQGSVSGLRQRPLREQVGAASAWNDPSSGSCTTSPTSSTCLPSSHAASSATAWPTVLLASTLRWRIARYRNGERGNVSPLERRAAHSTSTPTSIC